MGASKGIVGMDLGLAGTGIFYIDVVWYYWLGWESG
jgi:hypothetical protein